MRYTGLKAESDRLFAEAQCLDDAAYGLLYECTINQETMTEFSAAKAESDAKYVEARVAWERAQSAKASTGIP